MRALAHSQTSPSEQAWQLPQDGAQLRTTPSPGATCGDALADGDDRARALVAEDGGDGDAHGAVGQGQVGVADPGGGEPDPDLAGAGVGQVDVGDLQRSAHGGKYGGAEPWRRLPQNWRDLVWRYSARPCEPSSRPTPDCL